MAKIVDVDATFPPKVAPLFDPSHRAKIMFGGRGSGKAIDVDELIVTPHGWKRLGDIQIGDRVIDEAGRPCRVTEIHDKMPEIAHRLHFSDGAHIDCCSEHEWVTWTHAERKSFLRSPYDDPSRFPEDWPNWRRKADARNRSRSDTGPRIRTTQEIVDTLRHGVRGDLNHGIPTCAPLRLPEVDLPIDPYVLGYWLANGTQRDGYVTCGSYDGNEDYPHITVQFTDADYPLHRLRNGVWSNDRLRARLAESGLRDAKCVPTQYLRASESQRLALLRGLMDGDGTVEGTKGSVSFTNTNRAIAKAVFELTVSLGQKPTWREDRAKLYDKDCGPCFTVTWRPTHQPFSLPRKAALVIPLGAQALRCQHRMITAVDRIEPKPMRCLTVDAPNHMYLVGRRMIPTHNSWAAARALLLIGQQRKIRILCAREFQASLEDSVHQLLSDQILDLGLGDFYTVEKRTIYGQNGTEIRFAGLKTNPSIVRSFEKIDIVWCEEAQSISRTSWMTLIPTIRAPGSQIWVTMNPDLDTDESYKRWIASPPNNAWVCKLNYMDNPWFPDVLREEMEDLKKQNYEDYLHVYEGHCRQFFEGAVYLNELIACENDSRITKVKYDPVCAVDVFFDLGRADQTAIWFAQVVPGGEIHVIDHIEDHRKHLDHYLKLLSDRPYPINCVWLPHDAKAKTLGTKYSVEELTRQKGFTVRIVPNLSISDGINALRTIFPRLWFDKDKCADGLQALRHYRYEIVNDGSGTFKNQPVHDRWSHSSDAARYMAVALKAPKVRGERKYDHKPLFGGSQTSWMQL